MARVKYDEHTNGFGPRLVHVRVGGRGNAINYKFLDIPKGVAFDEGKYKITKKIKEKRTAFIEKFKNLSYNNIDVAPELTKFLENPPADLQPFLTLDVRERCFEYLHRAQGELE